MDQNKITSSAQRIVTIHQPDFLPWLGFFDRWRKSDVYIVLDNVQFLRRGWHNRDRIKTVAKAAWLTVPVQSKGQYNQLINKTKLDEHSTWRRKHLATLSTAYAKAPNFKRVYSKIKAIYEINHRLLSEFNLELLRFAAKELSITTPIVMASTLDVHSSSSMRLVELTRKLEGTTYYTGHGSKAYLDESLFHDAGIAVRWHDFKHPHYPQLHGEFVQGLSILDYLMMRPEGEIWPTDIETTNNGA